MYLSFNIQTLYPLIKLPATMIKTVFSAMFFLLCTSQLQAQISFLPEIGLSFANFSVNTKDPVNTVEKCTNKPRLKAGFSFKFELIDGLFLQPGLFHVGKGANTEGRYAEYAGLWRVDLYDVRGNVRLNYYELPLIIGYERAIRKIGSFFATTGIYWSYTSEGSKYAQYYLNGVLAGSDDDRIIGFGKDKEMKHSDIGLIFGVGYKMPIHLFIKAGYSLGIKNISNWNAVAYRNKGFSFTLGYDFKIPGNSGHTKAA